MSFIFWMSTGTFSAENTSSILEPLVLFFLPSVTHQQIDTIHAAIRKSAHISEYFMLGILLFRAFSKSTIKTGLYRSAFFSVLAVFLYAASDEFHQSFVSTRTASAVDVGIDTLGGVLAQIAVILGRRRCRRREIEKGLMSGH